LGTRYFVSIIHNGDQKVCQYGQWDGYPTHTGRILLELLRDFDLNHLRTALENTFITKTPYEDARSYTGSNKDCTHIYCRVFNKMNERHDSTPDGKWFSLYETTMQMLKDSDLSVEEADILLPSTRDTGVSILSYIYNRDLSLAPLELFALWEEYDDVGAFAIRECAWDVPGVDAQGYYVVDLDKNAVFMNFNDLTWRCDLDCIPKDINRAMALYEVKAMLTGNPKNIDECIDQIRTNWKDFSQTELTLDEMKEILAFCWKKYPHLATGVYSVQQSNKKSCLSSQIQSASIRATESRSTDKSPVKDFIPKR